MSTIAARLSLRGRLPALRPSAGITAIVVKELRGRMRGRRAFIIITLHVLLLSLFAWMFGRINEEAIASMGSYGGQATFASASIGRGIFLGLLMLQTLMVAVLAPAATAGSISSEREHQTLDLLSVTPISSLAIVLGKLVSGLAWVFVLILASIPVTAMVFLYGGVAPDDVVRGYIVLFATVVGLGSVGLFFSTLTRRTGAATGLTFVATLGLIVGSVFVWVYLLSTSDVGSNGLRRQPPDALLYLNPFVAQADVACGTEEGGFGGMCGLMSSIVGPTDPIIDPGFPVRPEPMPMPGVNVGGGGVLMPGVKGGVIIVDDGVGVAEAAAPGVGVADDVANAQAVDPWRDRFWPKSVLSFLFLAVVMTVASVQFVTPTRRWRPSLPGPVRRLIRRRST